MPSTETIHLAPFMDDGDMTEIVINFYENGDVNIAKNWMEKDTGQRDWSAIWIPAKAATHLKEALQRIPRPKRKVIQISQMPIALAAGRVESKVMAVCDDGTMWEICGGQWCRIEDIPQDLT
jgi:hypothetical protein